jgi:nitroimidazol reductase NimA-like FMN-containing flavoprotein (pyridoxamine 5'-phosphate oxidase superfamily)
MHDDPVGPPPSNPASPGRQREPTIWDPEVERLDEAECLRLIARGGVGRLGYTSRGGIAAVLPVRYRFDEGSILFRTPLGSPTDEDLRTGIQGAEYKVSFEIDDVGEHEGEGWMVFIQGDAHHMDSDDDWASESTLNIPPRSEHYLRITPTSIAGRRLRRT